MRVGNEREVAGLRVAELGLWYRETAREGAGSRAGQVKLAPQWRGGGWRRNGRTDGRRRGLAVRGGGARRGAEAGCRRRLRADAPAAWG